MVVLVEQMVVRDGRIALDIAHETAGGGIVDVVVEVRAGHIVRAPVQELAADEEDDEGQAEADDEVDKIFQHRHIPPWLARAVGFYQ